MGLLRFLLAFAVVIGHGGAPIEGVRMVHASVAVQLFYLVSGFYMGLILCTKYRRGNYWLFITNRLLRIYPAYLCVALITLCYLAYSRTTGHSGWSLIHWDSIWASLTGASRIFLIGANALILGQDAAMFMGLSDGRLYFTPNYAGAPEPHVYKLLLVPQSWSLSVELLFYFIAPFLIWGGRCVVVLTLILALGARWFVNSYLGYSFDPWNYRFFPLELGTFLLGALAFMLGRVIFKLVPSRFFLVSVGSAYIVLLLALPYWVDTYEMPVRIALIAATTCMLPILFFATQRSRVDRFIGELSYPIYLVHILVIWGVIDFGLPRAYVGLISLAMAVLLYVGVMRPVDQVRVRRAVDYLG